MLDTWHDGRAKSAIVDFVGRVTTAGADFVAAEERIAVFDNDGTLWCEKPAYVQLDFLVRRMAALADADPSLKARQPYAAAASGDLAWFGDAVTKHYQGDDSDIRVLGEAVLSANSAIATEDHAARVNAFFDTAQHPTLHRPYTTCGYVPMVDLLRYLEAHGFTCYIVSGGGRDFMRPITQLMYGIPPERVVGSSVGLEFRDGNLYTTDQPEFLDDGPVKPVRIWGRTGRRPIFAAGNSNGDIEMLQYTAGQIRPSLSMLVLHDDAEREFDYTAGAEKALTLAEQQGWTVTSIYTDWTTVFAGQWPSVLARRQLGDDRPEVFGLE
jgi:phosphoglycolate phosphatase-like HAD superfamily hydrolase